MPYVYSMQGVPTEHYEKVVRYLKGKFSPVSDVSRLEKKQDLFSHISVDVCLKGDIGNPRFEIQIFTGKYDAGLQEGIKSSIDGFNQDGVEVSDGMQITYFNLLKTHICCDQLTMEGIG